MANAWKKRFPRWEENTEGFDLYVVTYYGQHPNYTGDQRFVTLPSEDIDHVCEKLDPGERGLNDLTYSIMIRGQPLDYFLSDFGMDRHKEIIKTLDFVHIGVVRISMTTSEAVWARLAWS